MSSQAGKRRRLPKFRGPRLPLTVLVALSIVSLLVGILLMIRAGLSSETSGVSVEAPHPVVPASTVLQAAEAGGLVSVGLPVSATAATPALAEFTQAGAPEEVRASEEGRYLASFYISEEAGTILATNLSAKGVEVWFAPTAQRNAPVVGFRGAPMPGSMPEMTDQSMTLPASKVEAESSPSDALFIAGILLVLAGSVGLVSAQIIARRRAGRAAAQAIRESDASAKRTTFSDVAGCDEAVEQMRELVDFLKDPEKFEAMGAKIPAGALLCGPPGTGKTLLARALAGEAGVPLLTAAGSDFTEMYVGVGPKRIRELFAKARKNEKSIIFIDEVDAIARRRGGEANGAQEAENTLNALLTEMDGFHKGNTVVVIAATNRADILDPALTRPGRLERKIEVPLPDRRGREHILNVHARDIPLDAGISLEMLARRTPGFSGAQLESVLNEAAIESVRNGLDTVPQSCIDSAVAMVAMGRARTSALVTEHDQRITAWHEAGHLVCGLLLEDADLPVAVSSVPRGPAGGVTWFSEGDDQFMTRKKAHARLVTAMGGRAGEQLLLDGEYTQGASGDIQQATNIALNMAVCFGMTRLGLADRSQHLGGPGTKEVSDVVEELLAAALAEATDLLEDHRDLVQTYAEALLDFGDLDHSDIHLIATRFGVAPQGTPTPLTPLPQHAARPGTSPTLAPTQSGTEAERVTFAGGRARRLLAKLRPRRSPAT